MQVSKIKKQIDNLTANLPLDTAKKAIGHLKEYIEALYTFPNSFNQPVVEKVVGQELFQRMHEIYTLTSKLNSEEKKEVKQHIDSRYKTIDNIAELPNFSQTRPDYFKKWLDFEAAALVENNLFELQKNEIDKICGETSIFGFFVKVQTALTPFQLEIFQSHYALELQLLNLIENSLTLDEQQLKEMTDYYQTSQVKQLEFPQFLNRLIEGSKFLNFEQKKHLAQFNSASLGKRNSSKLIETAKKKQKKRSDKTSVDKKLSIIIEPQLRDRIYQQITAATNVLFAEEKFNSSRSRILRSTQLKEDGNKYLNKKMIITPDALCTNEELQLSFSEAVISVLYHPPFNCNKPENIICIDGKGKSAQGEWNKHYIKKENGQKEFVGYIVDQQEINAYFAAVVLKAGTAATVGQKMLDINSSNVEQSENLDNPINEVNRHDDTEDEKNIEEIKNESDVEGNNLNESTVSTYKQISMDLTASDGLSDVSDSDEETKELLEKLKSTKKEVEAQLKKKTEIESTLKETEERITKQKRLRQEARVVKRQKISEKILTNKKQSLEIQNEVEDKQKVLEEKQKESAELSTKGFTV